MTERAQMMEVDALHSVLRVLMALEPEQRTRVVASVICLCDESAGRQVLESWTERLARFGGVDGCVADYLAAHPRETVHSVSAFSLLAWLKAQQRRTA